LARTFYPDLFFNKHLEPSSWEGTEARCLKNKNIAQESCREQVRLTHNILQASWNISMSNYTTLNIESGFNKFETDD